jgi:hypothetical protein
MKTKQIHAYILRIATDFHVRGCSYRHVGMFPCLVIAGFIRGIGYL